MKVRVQSTDKHQVATYQYQQVTHNLTVHRVIKPDDLTTLNVSVLQGHAWFIPAEVN